MNDFRSLAPVVATLLLCVGGCSGSEYVAGTIPDPPDEPDLPPGNVTVAVIAHDVFGTPVSGANIKLLYSSGTGLWELDTVTDAVGQAQVTGGFEGVDGAIVSTAELYGVTRSTSAPVNDQLDFDVTLHPASAYASGVSRMSVISNSADGRQLEFSARLHIIEKAFPTWNFDEWSFGAIDVLPCMPDTGNDTPTFEVDCVQQPSNIDAPYEGSALTTNWVDTDPVSEPLAVSLLLDQGASVAVTDTADRRLVAAKYLQTQLEANDQVVLAAFAADDAGTGQAALLPTQPVTVFPTNDPAFTTDGRSYFQTIDALATLEGGASPLHAAIGEMIDFTASHAPANSRPVVVALASGNSDCGSPADCQAAEEALRQQSASTGVAVVVVGLSDPSGRVDGNSSARLRRPIRGRFSGHRMRRRCRRSSAVSPSFLDGRHGAIDVTIHLQSPVARAFASGNTVIGTLHVTICPWECSESVDIPFALRIP